MKKDNPKLNDGCLKIFKLINLLYEDDAEYNKVVDIFKDDVNEQSTNNIQVVLNKYINTLRVFGINIEKENNKFVLKSSLYRMNFTVEDLKSISILGKSAKNFPDKEISKNLMDFINILTFRMNDDDKIKLNSLVKNYDFSFFYSNLEDKIEQCQKICKDKFIINILFLKNNEELKCKCTAKDIIYDPETVYLRVYDIIKRENIDIPISNILSIVIQPQLANSTELTTTVVYKLKNRLAKTYKVKENECCLVVINKNEPFDKLLKRLMRYSYNCEIVSPKTLRNEMIKRIEDTLKNYKTD